MARLARTVLYFALLIAVMIAFAVRLQPADLLADDAATDADEMNALLAATRAHVARDPATIVVVGDSSLLEHGTLKPADTLRDLLPALAAEAGLSLDVLAVRGFDPLAYYLLADEIADLGARAVVLVANVQAFSDEWFRNLSIKHPELPSFLALRRVPHALTLPLQDAGVTRDMLVAQPVLHALRLTHAARTLRAYRERFRTRLNGTAETSPPPPWRRVAPRLRAPKPKAQRKPGATPRPELLRRPMRLPRSPASAAFDIQRIADDEHAYGPAAWGSLLRRLDARPPAIVPPRRRGPPPVPRPHARGRRPAPAAGAGTWVTSPFKRVDLYPANLRADAPSLQLMGAAVSRLSTEGITTIGLVLPLHQQALRLTGAYDRRDVGGAVTLVRSTIEANGGQVLDLSAILEREHYFADAYTHFTAEGNRVVAAHLLRALAPLLPR